MEFELSFIRALGIAIGTMALVSAFWRLRSEASSRADVWLSLFVGVGLISVALFPNIANIPSELFNLGGMPGGRLITLLIFSTLLLWYIAVSERAKTAIIKEQFDRLVRVVGLDEFTSSGQEVPSGSVMVIMPALNEAESLASVLPRMPQQVHGVPLVTLVLDDGSNDGTADVAREQGAIVAKNPFNRGGGAALRLGYDIADRLGATVVVTMDADGQHQPEEIDRLVEPIIKGNADIVIGSRVIGEREKDSAIRWVGIHFFNTVINILTGLSITDCSSGYRAFRLEKLRKVKLTQDQYHTAELIIDAVKKRMVIVESPITITRRLHGSSKKGTNFWYGFGFLKTVIKTWWR